MTADELDREEWLRAHREAGARPGNGNAMMADFVHPKTVEVWLQKRAELAGDPVVRDHLQRSLRWLRKALAAAEGNNPHETRKETQSSIKP